MKLSSRTKTTLAITAVLSTIGAVAWAQNLEVKGNAWFATGGSGSAGIGTANPLGKLHVIASGGFGAENADGTSQAGSVPIVGQSGSSVFGMLNASGRQVGAINVNGDGGTTAARGYLTFYDKTDGVWRASLFLQGGNAGVGTQPAPAYKLDVLGDVHAAGWLRTDGTAGWYSQSYGGGWFMQDTTWVRTYASKSVWTGSGLLGSDGGLTVGYGGGAPPARGAAIAGNTTIGGSITAGNSDIYFTNTNHNHTGIGNTAGYAALENSANYGTLMILGRSGTPNGRKVDVWDYLQVNGRIRATNGTAIYQLNSSCSSAVYLTTTPTCVGCPFGDYYCGPSGTECCNLATYNNTILGRLVDP